MSERPSLFQSLLMGVARGWVFGCRFGMPLGVAFGIVWIALGHTFVGILWTTMTLFGSFVAWKTPVEYLR